MIDLRCFIECRHDDIMESLINIFIKGKPHPESSEFFTKPAFEYAHRFAFSTLKVISSGMWF